MKNFPALICASVLSCACVSAGATDYVDVHLHLLGKTKDARGAGQGASRGGSGPRGRRGPRGEGAGPGFRAGGGRPSGPGTDDQDAGYAAAAQALLNEMDRQGVKLALLMPPPRTSDNADLTEVEQLLALARKHPGRFSVAAGGDVLNPLIHETPSDRVTERELAHFQRLAEGLLSRGVKAFGEISALHLSFFKQHVFEQTPPDHPLFLKLAEIAAKRNVAIDLHMEAVPADMDTPAGFDPESNPPRLSANIAAFERLLAHAPAARIVWQHIGWDNTGKLTPSLLRGLLSAHANLFLALRVEERPVTKGGEPMPNRIVGSDGKLRPEWLKLFESFPDRFVIGTDQFFGAPGTKKMPASFNGTWRILDQLTPAQAKQIGRENAIRIYRL